MGPLLFIIYINDLQRILRKFVSKFICICIRENLWKVGGNTIIYGIKLSLQLAI